MKCLVCKQGVHEECLTGVAALADLFGPQAGSLSELSFTCNHCLGKKNGRQPVQLTQDVAGEVAVAAGDVADQGPPNVPQPTVPVLAPAPAPPPHPPPLPPPSRVADKLGQLEN